MKGGTPFSKRVFMIAGNKTVQMGSGRKEFNPKDARWMENGRPHLEQMIVEAGRDVLKQVDPNYTDERSAAAEYVDSMHLGNFIIELTCNGQGHRSGLLSQIHPSLQYPQTMGAEGACCSGGLAMASGIKDILSGQSDVSLVVGAEEMNTKPAVYVADALAAAGHIRSERGRGHAFFFPGVMSDRVAAYNGHYRDPSILRKAMTEWVAIAYQNGSLDPKSQIFEHGMTDEEVRKQAEKLDPNFVEHLSYLDCSKVTDAAAAVILASVDGLERLGLRACDPSVVEILGLGMAARDITHPAQKPYFMETSGKAAWRAYNSAQLQPGDITLAEVHDCFSNIGVMMLEAAGFANKGKGPEFVLQGHTRRQGKLPTNTFGGLISGHPVGETGVRQAVDIYNQLTHRASSNQVIINNTTIALSLNMGGNDGTAVAIVYK